MSGAKLSLSVFFRPFGVAGLAQAGLAELLVDLDQVCGQSLEAAEVGDLLAHGGELLGADRPGDGLAVALEGERPVGAVEFAAGGVALAAGLAAAAGEGGERAGTHVAEVGEVGEQAALAELQGGEGRVGHGASFPQVFHT